MKTPSLRAGACAAGLLLAALSSAAVAAGHPFVNSGAAPATSERAQRHASQLTLDVRDLPAGRATMAQIARYYYGSRDLSFVLEAANPWLLGVRPDRRLATAAGHATIRVPVLRGARPLGPS
jgi:hypothetical protein